MKQIVRRTALLPPETLPAALDPLLRRVYAARGIASSRELEWDFNHLHRYSELRGIERAVELLAAALARCERILIVADFDADGATSCATLVRGLRLLGAADVQFLVPNRFAYGYGLTPQIVEVAAQLQPQLLVTVDNGISSIEGVAAARARGIKVLITDHHLPGLQLPDADAIVNPNQPGCAFPSKHLAGVGVVFYVLLALRARLRTENWFNARGLSEPNLAQLLDIVALGTVADVVPLDHCNRILVAQGLARIRAGRACAGIQALLEVANRDPAQIVAADLGFAVAPRLNAAGRLDDMSEGIACLLADDPAKARMLAKHLDELNRERRDIEGRMKEQAFAHVDRYLQHAAGELPPGLCLFDPQWHQGVIGIVAGRVKDRLHRPTIAFAPAGDDEIKGSARSIPGLHIRDALESIATQYPDVLTKFGGHAMAAGLTLPRAQLERFRELFAQAVGARLRQEDLQGVIYSDGELDAGQINLDTAELLRTAAPWGQGFPEPMFDGVFDVVNRRVVGERHLKLTLRMPGSRASVDAIAFNVDAAQLQLEAPQLRLAYKLDVNDYRGQRSPQLLVEYLQPTASL